MKVLYVHAHYDDFEFTAAGLFTLWRQQLGEAFEGRVLICTDGSAGHHLRSPEETAAVRLQEQQASARLGGYQFELLRLRDGRAPRDGALLVTHEVLAALWKAIRDFEPDYLLCPPWPSDPLAGIHTDHLSVAEAVRRVAYLINVPHAFVVEYPEAVGEVQFRKTPVVVQVYDSYAFGANAFDLAVNVEAVFDAISAMSWCHQSQIREWLPWIGRHQMEPPEDPESWRRMLHARFVRRNRELGLASEQAHEFFTVSAWGEVPTLDQLQRDWPGLTEPPSHLAALERRLKTWRGLE